MRLAGLAFALLLVLVITMRVGAAGAAITQFCEPGTGTACDQPGGVAVDSSGNVYVLDDHHGTLAEFNRTGQLLATITGGAGAGLPTHGLGGLAILPGSPNTVLVADPDANQLSQFTPSGNTFSRGIYLVGHSFIAVAVGPGYCNNSGSCSRSYIDTLDETGNLDQWNENPVQETICASANVGSPLDPAQGIQDQVAVTASGNLWVTEAGTQSLIRYASTIDTGSAACNVDLTYVAAQTLALNGYLTGLAIGDGGYLFVGDDNLGGTAYVRTYNLNFAPAHQMGWVRVAGTAGGLAIAPPTTTCCSIPSAPLFAGSASGGVSRIDSEPDPVVVPTPRSGLASQTVTFDGSQSGSFGGCHVFNSYEQCAGITSYSWNADGVSGTSPTISRQFNTPGTFPITLTVSDWNGNSATSTLDYNVGNAGASFSNPSSALTGQSVSFNAASSQIPYSSISDYAWDFDGSSSYAVNGGGSPNVSHVFAEPGTYTVQLRVTRSGGHVDTAVGHIVVAPTPPSGNVGVCIDACAYATNTPNVVLNLVWPAGASHAMISNDGGFDAAGGTKTVPLTASIPWTLRYRGGQLLPKIVYVRFPDGPYPTQTFTDDIVLDTTTPVVQSATLAGGGHPAGDAFGARVCCRVYVRAVERRSGISTAEFRHYPPRYRTELDHFGEFVLNAGASSAGDDVVVTFTAPTRRGIVNLNQVVSVSMTSRPRWVRVRSAAGTWSKWVKIT